MKAMKVRIWARLLSNGKISNRKPHAATLGGRKNGAGIALKTASHYP